MPRQARGRAAADTTKRLGAAGAETLQHCSDGRCLPRLCFAGCPWAVQLLKAGLPLYGVLSSLQTASVPSPRP